ncbi:MAG: hypothetical protein ABIK28_13475 [Planctomycetota bacterium]
MKNLNKIRECNLEQILLNEDLITQEQLDSLQEEQSASGDLFINVVLKNEYISEKELAKSLVKNYQLPFIYPQDYQMDSEMKEVLPVTLLHAHMVFPIDIFGDTLVMVSSGNLNEAIIRELETESGKDVVLYIAPHSMVKAALKEHFPMDEVTSELNSRMDELFGLK